MKTLILQSHRKPLPADWLEPCMASVEQWSAMNGYQYHFIDDELFSILDEVLIRKFSGQRVILTDLARLLWLKKFLQQDYQMVVWLDADFLVFKPLELKLPDTSYALGREVWVQMDKNHRLRAYTKVHNALLMFRKDNVFLDFYIETAEKLLRLNEGHVPPQFIGPKLLTALHNIARCPVMETAGMLSPLVISDILAGGGDALRLFREQSPAEIHAANLGASVVEKEGIGEREMLWLIDKLLSEQPPL